MDNTDRGKVNMSSENQRKAYYKLITVEENWNQYKPFEMEPIPLTEEWLERLGFGKIKIQNEEFECCIKVDEDIFYNLRKMEDKYIAMIVLHDLWQAAFAWNIQYVHQLQNLYFSLTGRELELKKSHED